MHNYIHSRGLQPNRHKPSMDQRHHNHVDIGLCYVTLTKFATTRFLNTTVAMSTNWFMAAPAYVLLTIIVCITSYEHTTWPKHNTREQRLATSVLLFFIPVTNYAHYQMRTEGILATWLSDPFY